MVHYAVGQTLNMKKIHIPCYERTIFLQTNRKNRPTIGGFGGTRTPSETDIPAHSFDYNAAFRSFPFRVHSLVLE